MATRTKQLTGKQIAEKYAKLNGLNLKYVVVRKAAAMSDEVKAKLWLQAKLQIVGEANSFTSQDNQKITALFKDLVKAERKNNKEAING